MHMLRPTQAARAGRRAGELPLALGAGEPAKAKAIEASTAALAAPTTFALSSGTQVRHGATHHMGVPSSESTLKVRLGVHTLVGAHCCCHFLTPVLLPCLAILHPPPFACARTVGISGSRKAGCAIRACTVKHSGAAPTTTAQPSWCEACGL